MWPGKETLRINQMKDGTMHVDDLDKVNWPVEGGLGLSLEQPQQLTSRLMSLKL